MADVVVAGAGRSGLIVARMLAERDVRVSVVERLPAAGGQEPESDAESLARAADRAGVSWRLGTIALERRPGAVCTLGVGGAESLDAAVLVLATGTRPATRAELGIVGDRGAGVLPGSVAHHYLDSGVLPGRHPLVVGDGQLAEELCEQLERAGASRVVRVRRTAEPTESGDGELGELGEVRFADATVEAVHGFPRVSGATVRQGGRVTHVATDAVLLAAGRIPMRNVEGALFASDDVVECFSSADPKTHEDAVATATRACEQALAAVGRRTL
ncbi:MAG TPA: FAD-dependent oxidoreductase [Nocardioides sp.]|jgi:pyruvate/2-oxoglutarate dehydrogenase complex dihydrolipoamide dehydrogenase (E3) component|uniref:FAD-dependent oxidoreductase n=1 Tax=Nocardioides sp. TaxID=35761 RepID=UPI002E36901D|nr:FAD-dependent oxidoreductase [Nocardioides sp.]HEX3929395.1 FAD-dependent oxidoreductase [Nocardioides sp.]